MLRGFVVLATALGPSDTSVLAAARPPALRSLGMPIEIESHCFPAGGTGTLSLNLPDGYIALTVSPGAPIPRMTSLVLAGVDPASVPGTPGRPNSAVIFYVGAEENCGANLLSELPVAVTLSVAHPRIFRVSLAIFTSSEQSPCSVKEPMCGRRLKAI